MNVFRKFFFLLSPFLIYKVSGKSMLPGYQDGDTVIAQRVLFNLKKNDVIIVHDPRTNRRLIKRINDTRIKNQSTREYFVVGDNASHSTDSRNFGWVSKNQIVGKVIIPAKKYL